MKHLVWGIVGMVVNACAALGQIDPVSGIDFVTIGNPGNAPWMGNGRSPDLAIGRGSVNYTYHIGRDEVNTGLWAEFFSAALDRPSNDRIPFVYAPTAWSAQGASPRNPGGQRFTTTAATAMLPTGGVDWRTCAILCNWLCSGKRTDRAAFLNGAYDVSTFGYSGNFFTDQPAHNPNAQFWIPTWDEYLKASHYDPNKGGPGVGGWWVYSNGTDTPLTPGPPRIGQANFGFSNPSPFVIPLGAYSTVSPYGLKDAAGGTSEWTESIITIPGEINGRYFTGSYWNSSPAQFISDSIYSAGSEQPDVALYRLGLRVASAVPSVSSCIPLCALVALCARRRVGRTGMIFP